MGNIPNRAQSRRKYLRGIVGGATVFVAGCSYKQDETRRERLPVEVFVANETSSSRTIQVTAFRDDRTVFEHTYDLDAGYGDESQGIEEIPTDVLVEVEGGRTKRQRLTIGRDCERADVDIWITDERIAVNSGCTSE